MDHIGRGFRKFMNQPNVSEQYENMIRSVLADPEVHTFLETNKETITQEMISNSYSKLHEFVQEKRKLTRGEMGQNPGYQPELALNAGYIDVVYVPDQATIKREREKELRSRINSINISKEARKATMEQFRALASMNSAPSSLPCPSQPSRSSQPSIPPRALNSSMDSVSGSAVMRISSVAAFCHPEGQ